MSAPAQLVKALERLNAAWNPALLAQKPKVLERRGRELKLQLFDLRPYIRPVMRPMHRDQTIGMQGVHCVPIDVLLTKVQSWVFIA